MDPADEPSGAEAASVEGARRTGGDVPGDGEAYVRAMELARLVTRPATRSWLQGERHRDFSLADMWLLLHLSERGPAVMSDLAHWQQVNRSTMTVQVIHLERRGLLVRSPDVRDHRVVLVRLTEAGRTAAHELESSVARAFGLAMDGWTRAEREMLAGLLARLAEGLDAARGQTAPGDREAIGEDALTCCDDDAPERGPRARP